MSFVMFLALNFSDQTQRFTQGRRGEPLRATNDKRDTGKTSVVPAAVQDPLPSTNPQTHSGVLHCCRGLFKRLDSQSWRLICPFDL